MFWPSLTKKLIGLFEIGLYIQSICFFVTIPILYFWGIPLSLVAALCNIILGPIMFLFLAFCLIFFVLGHWLPDSFCLLFCQFTKLWLCIMKAIPVESLVLIDSFLLTLWATCLGIIFFVYFCWPELSKRVVIVLFLYLNILAATNGSVTVGEFQLNSKAGSITVWRDKGKTSAVDNGFLSKRNGSFMPQIIRKELLLKFQCAKLNKLTVLKVNAQVLKNITTLAKMANLQVVEFDPKVRRGLVSQGVLNRFIGQWQELGVSVLGSTKAA